MIVCARAILNLFKNYLEINNINCLEKVNYVRLSEIILKEKISYKIIKNNNYFMNFSKKASKKQYFLSNKRETYKNITTQLSELNGFAKTVKTIFKTGVEIPVSMPSVFNALAITPFLYSSCYIVDTIAQSGMLNAFLCAV